MEYAVGGLVGFLAAGFIYGLTVFGWARAIKKSVIVQLKTGDAIKGILYAKRGSLLVLKNAMHLGDGGPRQIDGEALVLRAEIDWIQVVD